MELEKLLEAILFYKGEPLSVAELAKATHAKPDAVSEALGKLKESLSGRGIALVMTGDTVALATAPEAGEPIAEMRKEELSSPLGKAGLETLAIVIYDGPVSRADVEYIRGVNCQSILRSLTMRGLIERIENPDDARSYLYRATVELPAVLGVSALTDLPGYAETRTQLDTIREERQAAETPQETEHAVEGE